MVVMVINWYIDKNANESNIMTEVTTPVKKDLRIPIASRMKADGINAYDLARAAHVSRSTANNVVLGHISHPDVEQAIRLLYPDLDDQVIFGEDRPAS
jgi:ACT domain-containing protein